MLVSLWHQCSFITFFFLMQFIKILLHCLFTSVFSSQTPRFYGWMWRVLSEVNELRSAVCFILINAALLIDFVWFFAFTYLFCFAFFSFSFFSILPFLSFPIFILNPCYLWIPSLPILHPLLKSCYHKHYGPLHGWIMGYSQGTHQHRAPRTVHLGWWCVTKHVRLQA